MNRVLGALKATYNFFAGDTIILSSVAVAFILAELLLRALSAPNAVVAVIFVAIIVGGLTATLSRELLGRKRS